MSRSKIYEELIYNMEGRISYGTREFMEKQKAYETLVKFTGQDFGDDFEAWKKWFEVEGNEKAFYEAIDRDYRESMIPRWWKRKHQMK